MSRLDRRRRGGCWLFPLVLVGCLGVGVGLGLLISWWLWPVEYTDVSPDTLRPAHRLEYIVLIAQAYRYDGDLRRAQIRLAALGDLAEMGLEVVNLAEQQAVQGASALPADVERIRALAALAHGLGYRRSTLAAYLPGGPGYVPGALPTSTWTPWPTATSTLPPATNTAPPATNTALPTATVAPPTAPPATATPVTAQDTPTTPAATGVPSPTPTARPTRTPVVRASATPSMTPSSTATSAPTLTPTATSTPEPRYELAQQSRICPAVSDPHAPGEPFIGGQLRITVLDQKGNPQPGVELLIRWSEGEDRVFTGLKPEIGAGYADLQMTAGQSYQVGVIGMASDVAQDIVADECIGEGMEEGQIASWEIVFQLRGVASPE